MDLKRTAFSRRFKVKTFADGTYIVRVLEYDCLGKMKSDIKYREIPGPDTLKMGQKDARSLKQLQEGCCPPQLTKDFIEQEGALIERDPVEEAMKLHKRGYFGGGG